MAPHTRSRTGCWTCREAGYKCDERKPFCGRCTRLNITCKGYGIKLKWRTATIDPTAKKRSGNGRTKSVGESDASSPLSTSSVTSAPATLDGTVISSSQHWSHGLEMIPRTTTPSTLPDLSTGDKRLLNYWVEQLSSLISVTPRGSVSSPYQIYLTSMACNEGALRSTVLSMAAQHLALVSQDEFLRFDAYRHQRDAIQQLQRLIRSPQDAYAEPALATVLMMQVSTRLFGEGDAEPQVANHLIGAKAMVTRRGEGMMKWRESPASRFLLSLFAYHDILSSVSRGARPFIDHRTDFDAIEGMPSMKSIADVLHIVAGISELQDVAKLDGGLSNNPAVPSRFQTTGSSLERALNVLDLSLQTTEGDSASMEIMFTAEAYRHAAYIYLYRVWLGIGAPNPTTLHHVQQCLFYLGQVQIQSPLVSSHIWPLFTAGCETIDLEERRFVRDRFASMFQSRKFPVMKRIVIDIEDVWACKDLESIVSGQDGMEKVDCIQVIRRQRGREVDLA